MGLVEQKTGGPTVAGARANDKQGLCNSSFVPTLPATLRLRQGKLKARTTPVVVLNRRTGRKPLALMDQPPMDLSCMPQRQTTRTDEACRRSCSWVRALQCASSGAGISEGRFPTVSCVLDRSP